MSCLSITPFSSSQVSFNLKIARFCSSNATIVNKDEHGNNHTDKHKNSPSSSSVAPAEPPSDSQPPPAPPPPSSSSPPPGSIARKVYPGFYKAVVLRNPAVVVAIKEMMKRGQPYLDAFLLKDENTDADVITDINQVHQVGVFAQITSVFTAPSSDGAPGESLTAVLYPHRRIRITLEHGRSTTSDGNPSPPQKVKSLNNPLPRSVEELKR
ncbi:hypothetical protein F5887DRAFT_1256718 [Amanita rubescens]|nr:hypothetical protein F5887DRAFT_1256718 [Amanita rubescens]